MSTLVTKHLRAFYIPLRDYFVSAEEGSASDADDTLRRWTQSVFLPKIWQRPSTLSDLIKAPKRAATSATAAAASSSPAAPAAVSPTKRKRHTLSTQLEEDEASPRSPATKRTPRKSPEFSRSESSMADDEESPSDHQESDEVESEPEVGDAGIRVVMSR